MGLMKAPSIATFLVAMAIAVTALLAKLGLVPIPFFSLTSFWLLLSAFVLLGVGVVTRGF
ncbi:MAG: hypothetical protein AAFR70_03305 [Pseudomonadota bacterium]